MAFMNQEQKSSLAPAIKAVLKKYNMKGTIGVKNHSTLVVNLQSGPIDFGNAYRQVNEYAIDRTYTGTALDFLTELVVAMKGDQWFDRSDMSTDYFNTAYYLSINVGQWNKPYVCTAVLVEC